MYACELDDIEEVKNIIEKGKEKKEALHKTKVFMYIIFAWNIFWIIVSNSDFLLTLEW